MKITDKLNEAHKSPAGSAPTYSFEYFVPKTSQGVQNLYDRMDRMYGLGPAFVDITWNAGGRLSNLTCEIVETAQATLGLETCMHLTCTGMPREVVENALKQAHDAGCQNILALRGDPPHESEKWTATEGGFSYAKDLVSISAQRTVTILTLVWRGTLRGTLKNQTLTNWLATSRKKSTPAQRL